MNPQEAALAALRDGRLYSHAAEKPVKLKTESGVSLEIPGPRLLAQTYALPWLLARVEAYRVGSVILTRPLGSAQKPTRIHQGELSESLLEALETLPEDNTAGRPYRDLRLFLTEATPGRRAAYLAETIAHLRRLLQLWRPIKERAPRGPGKTAVEHLAAHRERVKADELVSAREWLENYLGDPEGRPAPGSRVVAHELHQECSETIATFIDGDEEREDGGSYRIPRQRIFYAVADEILGPRRRGANGSARVYLIPST